jgi:hypothetical protein
MRAKKDTKKWKRSKRPMLGQAFLRFEETMMMKTTIDLVQESAR